MIVDLSRSELPAAWNADVCVVGAGAAGISLALDLARRGISVAMLESGGRNHEPEIHDLNKGEIVGLPHTGIHEGRFRALGGTTTRWGGQMLPLQPIDFEPQGGTSAAGWPIRYEELQPYFEVAAEFAGLRDALWTDAEVWRSIGLDAPALGSSVESFLSRWCPEPDFARLHGKEIERLAGLTCVLHATVTTIEATGPSIDAVVARALNGRRITVRSRCVVFCVGGIETARLLLHPLSDGMPAPWAKSYALGRFFQDHPGIACADVIPRDPRVIHSLFDNIFLRGLKYQPRFRLTAACRSRMGLRGVGGGILFETKWGAELDRTKSAAKALLRGRADRQVAAALLASLRVGPLVARQAWRTFVQDRAYNPADRGFRLGADIEQMARPESRISLADASDEFGMRRARLDWRLGPEEIESVAVFAELARTAFRESGIAEVRLDPDVAARSSDVLERFHDQNHHMGTARMAAAPDEGVVDATLKIHGSDNAYVCSSAVFPSCGFSNPTHTLLALAFRLSDHLRKELKRG